MEQNFDYDDSRLDNHWPPDAEHVIVAKAAEAQVLADARAETRREIEAASDDFFRRDPFLGKSALSSPENT